MPILRLAYITLFLVALFTVFTLWSQVGGQGHLDLIPWYVKLILGMGAAYSVVQTAAAAVAGKRGWNTQSVRWFGLTLATLFLCGLASFYAHTNLEDTGEEDDTTDDASIVGQVVLPDPRYKFTIPAISAPIASDAVAAGLGAFNT